MHTSSSLLSSLVTLAIASSSLLLAACPGASSDDPNNHQNASHNDQKAPLFAASCPDPTPWSTTLDGIGVRSVVFDSQCNIVLSAEIIDPASARLGDQKIDLPKGWTVMKIGADGKLAWAKSLGALGSGPVDVTVAAMADGDIVVGGVFDGTIALASGNLVAGADHSFVARLDGNGDARWGRLLPGDVTSVLADLGTGEPVLAGSFTGTIDLGGASLKSVGGIDIFVLRLDGDGSTKKATSMGDKFNDVVASAAMASDGGLVISGGWGMSLNTACDENGGCSPYDDRDGVVVRVNAEGQLVWKNHVEQGGLWITAGEIAASPNGDIAVWELTSPTLHVLDGNGTERWHKTFERALSGSARYDAAGELVLAGYFFSDDGLSPDFGDGPLAPQAPPQAAYVAKLDGGGAHVFSASFGNALVSNLDVTAGGAMVMSGAVYSDADFGSGVLQGSKTTSFVARLGAKTLASQ